MHAAHRLKVFFNSIKGKIFTLFLVAFLAACGLTLLNVWTLAAVRERLHLSERYDDLSSAILEARRFEKNLLIYGGVESRREGMLYLDQANAAFADLAEDIGRVSGSRGLEDFRQTLDQYRREFAALDAAKDGGKDLARTTGKRLVDMAEELIATKRARIHKTIFEVSLLPFAYLGIFLVFMAILIRVIATSLLTPLSMIGDITARVAKGDFSPVDGGGHHIEEVAGLLEALNRMALELTANQEDLLQARKIAALGTLTAGIAHEINNPINNIALSAESLLEVHGDALDDDAREIAGDILAQADRAGEIVRNLLDFSRTEKAQFSPLAPELIIKSSVALLKNQIMISGLAIHLDVPHDLGQVAGNLRHLQQVFLNLLLNAVQATPPGGTIEVAGRDASDFVCLSVRDSGKGIDPEHLPHIFEPFFTTKEVGKGTGLGLAVTYSLIKRHSGRIEVESEPGQGTAFFVYLPKAAKNQTVSGQSDHDS
ncbi:Two-component sensor histidine kinase [Desulfovibrio sp. DV]|uniref:sensor histidine kinase n=1 Tax=Desulfovibrio sp. DV TaxID=1844708 RepID=UPI00094BA8AB|nr:HAMP domain-containing sensor histidine kinase [Desulfovibrio sp. DV]OLN27611.1 Two-component sensor histidine kinase [Desulfovibrio sp. DV]